MDRSFAMAWSCSPASQCSAPPLALHAILLEAARRRPSLLGWPVDCCRRRARRGCAASSAGLVRQRRGEIALYTLGSSASLIGLALVVRALSGALRPDVGAVLAVPADGHDAQASGEARAHHVLPRPDDARDRRALSAGGLEVAEGHRRALRSNGESRAARMLGVEFAGTSILESGGRKLQVNGPTETEIANGILRVSQGRSQQSASSKATASRIRSAWRLMIIWRARPDTATGSAPST